MEEITQKNLMEEIECILKDEFVANVARVEDGIKICFLNGKSFLLRLESCF